MRYESDALSGLADTTAEKVSAVFNVFERIVSPGLLKDVTTERISYYQRELRKLGRAEQMIKGCLNHMRAALNWAVKIGMLQKAPRIDRPKRAKSQKIMRGRPIATEEFERLLAKTEVIVGPVRAPSWRHLLTGLWWSGLRLAEAIELT